MKLPFVSRSHFGDMLWDKNLQIRHLQIRITRLENDRHALWCTREQYNEMVKEKDHQIQLRDAHIARLEHEYRKIMEWLPDSVFDPPDGGGGGSRSKRRRRGGQKRRCPEAGNDLRPAQVVGPKQNAATGETAGTTKAALPERIVAQPGRPDDREPGGSGGVNSDVASTGDEAGLRSTGPATFDAGVLVRNLDGPYVRMGRPRARDIVRKMDRLAHQRWLEKYRPAKAAERQRDEVMAELERARREGVEDGRRIGERMNLT